MGMELSLFVINVMNQENLLMEHIDVHNVVMQYIKNVLKIFDMSNINQNTYYEIHKLYIKLILMLLIFKQTYYYIIYLFMFFNQNLFKIIYLFKIIK